MAITGASKSADPQSPIPSPDYVVMFRTGGTDNFKWHASLEMRSQEATTLSAAVRRMGYFAYCEYVPKFKRLGLPTTYNVTDRRLNHG